MQITRPDPSYVTQAAVSKSAKRGRALCAEHELNIDRLRIPTVKLLS